MSMLQSERELDVETLAKQFWAIGDPVRLRILQMLPTEPTCEHACNVSAIAERVGLSQPAASHHLRILRQAGIITNRKMCRDMIYWVQPEAIKALTDSLGELG